MKTIKKSLCIPRTGAFKRTEPFDLHFDLQFLLSKVWENKVGFLNSTFSVVLYDRPRKWIQSSRWLHRWPADVFLLWKVIYKLNKKEYTPGIQSYTSMHTVQTTKRLDICFLFAALLSLSWRFNMSLICLCFVSFLTRGSHMYISHSLTLLRSWSCLELRVQMIFAAVERWIGMKKCEEE